MIVKINLVVLLVHGITLCHCIDEEWSKYEKSFKNVNNNKEEIFVANATENLNFVSNFIVERWKTLTVGKRCYTGGITQDFKLVILFSSLSEDGLKMEITHKTYDLNVQALDFQFFHRRKNGHDKIMLVIYNSVKQEFLWYTLDHFSLKKMWNWSLEKNVSYFEVVKMENRNMFFAITSNNFGVHSADIYEFDVELLDRWFYQSVPLTCAATSSCFSTVDSMFYLSIPQASLNQLQIYQYADRHFIPYQNLSVSKIDQVVCFENGFKSFIAFNGLEAGIYEITEAGLTKKNIINSNLGGIQFWLPVPVNTYRDETVLFCQRKLDHGTHHSFDVDVITYNGNRFEEHVDIPCVVYGERQNGLKCLTDIDFKKGMYGSSYIAVADHLSLIVPVTNSTSLLFDLNVGMREMGHPAKNDIETYVVLQQKLQAMMEKQNKEHAGLIEQRQEMLMKKHYLEKNSQLKTTDFLLKASLSKNSDSKILKLRDEIVQVAKDLENLSDRAGDGSKFTNKKNKFAKIIFNGPVDIHGELFGERVNSNFIGGENADYLINDIVRKDQLRSIEGHKTFTDLTIEEINFENVNGILSNSFVTSNNDQVQINGDLIFNSLVDTGNVVTTSGLVNGVDINDNWISLDQNIKGPLEFEHLKVRDTFKTKILITQENNPNFSNDSTSYDEFADDVTHESIFIPGNVTVKTLNGQNFENFLRKLCLRSLKCHVPNLKINGVVNCKGSAHIQYLNDLKFPEDYVALDSTEKALTITGYKDFTKTIRGYKILTENDVNNINLNEIITRSDEQELFGNITFEKLEVVSALKVDGNVTGQGLANFVPNLGLKDTRVIKANVKFINLEVQGKIIVENNFNGSNFNQYFKDFILKDEENVEISGNKSFPEGFTALKNLRIDTNKINDIPLDSIITKDSSQELHITSILGAVDCDHLYVKGRFDGEYINELNKSLIRLVDSQTINSQVVFLEELNIGNLVFEELNDLDQKKGSAINENHLHSTEDIIFDALDVEVLEVEGNIIGSIDQFDLENLPENYLSYNKNQIISEPYYIQKLHLDNLNTKNINGIGLDNTFSYIAFKNNVTDFLLYRNPKIESLNVEGNLDCKIVNNREFGKLIENDVWIKIYKNGSKILAVEGNVYFDTLQIQNMGSADFNEYISKLIFKNETDVYIHDSIIFENDIKVEKLIETKTLNDVPLENILRKNGDQTILGPINIFGNVTVEDDLQVKEMVNNVDVEFIANSLIMKDNTTIVKGEVMFQRLAYINNLITNGTINGKDFNKIKSQFVYKNVDIILDKDTRFNDAIHIIGNLGITNDINGIILSDFVSKVVWVTQDTDIEGPVKFTRAVECFESINVNKELNTQFFFGQNLEEQVNSGVFINRGLTKGIYNFDNIAINEILNTQIINNLNLSNVIPLKSDQEIDTLELTEVSIVHDTEVGGKVNGIKLMEEFERTVLKNVQQKIPSEVVFLNNVVIEDNLITPKINNKPSSKIVTTNTNQNLTAVYSFNTKSWTDGDIIVQGLVNGINLTFWNTHAVPVNLDTPQEIKKQWTVMNDLNLVGPVAGNGLMNGINITNLIKEVREKESYMCEIEKGIFEDYKNLCTDMTYIYENSKNQIYKFKYFEELQNLSLPHEIHYVKYFEDHGKQYLLINDRHGCLSHLMVFQQNGFYPLTSVHTGIISQAEVVKDQDRMFLVTRGEDSNESVCKIVFSTVVWTFTNQNLQIFTSLENQELLQESLIPSTFYGLKNGIVTEFKIEKSPVIGVRRNRRWDIIEDNVAFFPRGLKTGLALRTGKNIIYLNRNDPIVEEYNLGADTEAVTKGTFKKDNNFFVPGRSGGTIAVTNVGMKKAKKSFLAVASHKEARVEHRLDIIEIYQDPFMGELFDKIPTYKPSSLTSIEFKNGETIFVFMEGKKVLQIYEYKGIEGFKYRSSIKIPANEIFLMELPIGETSTLRKVLGLVHKNAITMLQAIMVGNKIKDDFKCSL